jgi:hypothetical protein
MLSTAFPNNIVGLVSEITPCRDSLFAELKIALDRFSNSNFHLLEDVGG